MTFPLLSFAPVVVAGGASQTFVDATGSGSDGSTQTYSSHALGSTSNGDYVLVGCMCDGQNTSTTLSSATIDGTSATILAQFNDGFTTVAFFIASVASSTGDIVFNLSASKRRSGVVVWRVDGLLTPLSVHDSDAIAEVGSLSIDVAAGGLVFGVSTGHSAGAGLRNISGASGAYASSQTGLSITTAGYTDITWTEITEDAEEFAELGSGDGASIVISMD